MSQASTSSAGAGDGANIDLGASVLLTSMDSGTGMLRRRISLKKPTSASSSYESPQSSFSSSVPYTSLPPSRTSSAKSSVAIDIGSHAEEEGEAGIQQQRIRNDIARIVKEQDSESLRELGGVDRVRDVLCGQRQHSQESTNNNGNTVQVHGTSLSGFIWNSCKNNRYTVSMLLISAALSFATEFKQEGARYGWHDGVAIVLAVLLLVAFSSITNFLHERKVMKLAERKGQLKFTVQRGEESPWVDLADIVVGDMVHLRPHDEVPADGLLVSANILVLAEGTKKEKIDRERPFLIAGSKVIAGYGCMLVVSVGNKSNLAEMQSSVTSNPEKSSLLESLIERPISYIDKASLFIFTLVAIVVLIRLICHKNGDSGGLPEIKGNISVGWLREMLERIFSRPPARISILTGLFTAVILSVQHGVPLVVTISLNYLVGKVDQDAVLNDLSACTTMGLVTVICIDVSGELISKPMEVSRIWMGEEADISKVEGSETDIFAFDMLKQGVGLSVLAPELSLCPMSDSLVSWAETWGMDIKSFPEKFDILKHSKLNSDKESSGVLVREVGNNEQVLHLHWSGAASSILEMCSQYYDSQGGRHAMENQRTKFGQVIREMEVIGLKPIAFAYRETKEQEELEQDELTLLALIGLKYKGQESTKLALENLKDTGMKIKLVSEDDIMLVKDIACELGIEDQTGHGTVLEGKEFRDLNVDARLLKVDQGKVMGRFGPEDKRLMVQCLQDKGHVVAFVEKRLMTNHTSEVLKVADVGIVHNSLRRMMDGESCSISITCFNALKPIVRAGRSKYYNIQKFIQLQLTVSISGLLITLITTIITGKSPLTAVQLIWVNVLMCLLGGLMMAMELSSEKELDKNPSDRRNQPIITKGIWRNVVIQVLYQAIVCIVLEFGGHVTDNEKKVRETMIFNTFLLCQLFNLLSTMDLLKGDVLKIVVQSYCFWVALGGCLFMQVVVIEYAKGLADCMRLNATGWAVCVPVGAVPWVFEWALKKILPVILGTNCASSPMGSPESNQQQPGFYLSWGFPFMMLLLFPLGLIGIAMTFR